MQTLVTATTGFTAIPLVRLLIKQGHSVKALMPNRGREQKAAVADLQRMGLEFITGDPMNPADLARATRGVEVVFHLEWQSNAIAGPQGQNATNGLQRLIDACRQQQVARLVFTSTTAVYGSSISDASTPVREDDRLGAISTALGPRRSSYVERMRSAEQLIRDHLPNPDYVIARIPLVYGAHTQFAYQLVERALSASNPASRADVSQWLHIEDLTRALLLAAETPEAANETFTIAGAEAARETDLMAFIGRRAQRYIQSGGLSSGGGSGLPLVGANLDIGKAQRILHFIPSVPLSKGIDAMLADVLEHPPPATGAGPTTAGTQTPIPGRTTSGTRPQADDSFARGTQGQAPSPSSRWQPQPQRQTTSKIGQQGGFNHPFKPSRRPTPGQVAVWGRGQRQTRPAFSWEPPNDSGNLTATGSQSFGQDGNPQNIQHPFAGRFSRNRPFVQSANRNRPAAGSTSNNTINHHTEAEARFDPKSDPYRGWLAWIGFSELFGKDDTGFLNFGLWTEETASRRQACENLTDTLLSYLPDKAGNILDVGCGAGTVTQQLLAHYPAKNITGIDIDKEQIRICATKLPDIDFQVMDAAGMDYVDETYDNLICTETALHIQSREKFLKEAFRILKPGGRILFSDLIMPAHTPSQPRDNEAVSTFEAYRQLCLDCSFSDVFLLETTESWGRCASYLENLLRGKVDSGVLPTPRYRAITRSLRHTLPNAYIFGWCKKEKQ